MDNLNDPCIFCEILAGRADASMIYKDDVCSAFLDIRPVNPGHTLIIPNVHAPYLNDLDPETGAVMFQKALVIADALRSCRDIRCDGINLFLADGQAAMQEVFHVHLHVLPRFNGDGFSINFPDGYGTLIERNTLDSLADALKKNL